MIVSAPWEYTALIQQLIANLEDSGTPGLFTLDLNLKLRQTNLLQNMVQIFQALENSEPVTRAMLHQGGDSRDNTM